MPAPSSENSKSQCALLAHCSCAPTELMSMHALGTWLSPSMRPGAAESISVSGLASKTHSYIAGVGSTLPARSTAATSNRCVPALARTPESHHVSIC